MTDQLVKVLLFLPRKKENEEIASEQMQHRKCFRKVWATPEEREVRIRELQSIAGMYPEYKWRIYETVNWRDLRKSYFSFQQRVLDWQRSDKDNSMEWLQHYNSEWVSNLMRPENKDKKDYCFLIDKDDRNHIDSFREMLKDKDIVVVKEYQTVNGVHFLVKPFNIQDTDGLKDLWNVEIHKDGQTLIWVSDGNRWFNRG